MKNKIFKYIKLTVLLLFVVIVGLQLSATSIVEGFLTKKIPNHIHLNYERLSVNILIGKIRFSTISLQISNRDNTDVHSELNAKELTINGLGFWQFFMNNTLAVRELTVDTPNLEYHQDKRTELKDKSERGIVRLIKSIAIEKSTIENGSFSIDTVRDSILFKVGQVNFELMDAKTNTKLIAEKIPLTYDSYFFSAQELFFDLGDYEKLTIQKINIAENIALFKAIDLNTKYNKIELSKRIAYERDHMTLEVPSVELADFDFGFSDDRFYFNSESSTIIEPRLEIYRDKRVADDKSKKPMYGEVLRALPLAVAVDSITVVNGVFQYEERTWVGTDAGLLFFNPVNVMIANVGNTYDRGEKTVAELSAQMMGEVPVKLKYEFDTNDPKDKFRVQGSLKQLRTAKVNSFLKPSIGVQTSGVINELYFTVGGNDSGALGDMKMKYSDFHFELLRKDKSGINKALTTIGNWFINDGQNTDDDGYRHGDITVERDNRKSFFNYIWIMVEDGVLNTLTGKNKGKRKED